MAKKQDESPRRIRTITLLPVSVCSSLTSMPHRPTGELYQPQPPAHRVGLSFLWIIGAAVDSKADDMTKKGVRITSEIDPKRRAFWNHV
jgi:hypothetical protein